MLEQLNKAKTQWGGHHSLIDQWLDDRQQLLINYCAMFKREEANTLSILPDNKTLTLFCQKLVDYISLGHFEVYESLVADCKEQGESSLYLARKLYPEITITTEIAIAFNDKYSKVSNVDEYNILTEDLSNLGETLAIRIELEDQLIDTFHKNH